MLNKLETRPINGTFKQSNNNIFRHLSYKPGLTRHISGMWSTFVYSKIHSYITIYVIKSWKYLLWLGRVPCNNIYSNTVNDFPVYTKKAEVVIKTPLYMHGITNASKIARTNFHTVRNNRVNRPHNHYANAFIRKLLLLFVKQKATVWLNPWINLFMKIYK